MAGRGSWRWGCVWCLVLLPAVAPPRPARAEEVDPRRFEVSVLATGLVQPMELAVAADGTVYWVELAGRLLALRPGAGGPEVVGELTVTTAQENGLIGLALDPAFATTGWVYLQYSPPDFQGQRVSRFTIRDGRLDPASEKVLLAYEEQRKECCHHAGSLAFGPGGDLFIATGDNTHPHGDSAGYAPLDERPDRAPWDAQKSSANTRSHNGKILRIHPEPDGTASIPAGNLFPADGSAGLPEIYCMGCRNPWRMSVDGRTGTVYWGDVGPDANADGPRGSRGYDEINQARAPGNFGWPYFIGDNRPYADHDFATDRSGPLFDPQHPVNASPNNTGSRDLPPARPALLYYPYGTSAEFPALGDGGRTACAGPVYHAADHGDSPARFPDHYDNTLFVFEWTRHWIMAVRLDADERVVAIEPFLPHHPFVRPIDMQFGADGALVVIEYGDTWGVNANARLVRIEHVRGNRRPMAVAVGENTVGRAPLVGRFSAAGSADPDDDPLRFTWRVQRTAAGVAEPPRDAATGPEPTITFTEPGVYTVEVEVADPHGGCRTAAVPVVVGNDAPRVRFAEPADGDFIESDQPLRFRLVVDDTEDGTTADDRDDAEPLTSADVPRAGVRASFASAAMATPRGLERMQRSDCFNCHAVDQPRVGPPLVEIAAKYRGQPGAVEASVERVLKGSAGVWGKVPMLPHGHHTPAEVREMVSWIHGLERTALPRVFQGFTGEIPVDAEALARAGGCRLEASYLDRGGPDGIPPLAGAASVSLRPRRIEAEAADSIVGPEVLGAGSASAGRFIGAVDHGDTLLFRAIPLDTVGQVTLRLASAGAGGEVELRLDSATGPVLARVPVEVNGQWEQFYDRAVPLPPTTGRHDVVVRFTHPQQAGGLCNLDTVVFGR
jgi:cytochrome c